MGHSVQSEYPTVEFEERGFQGRILAETGFVVF